MIAVVVGTRPELIKTAPVLHELRRRDAPFMLVHSGQHYTPSLDDVFFRDLDLPPPFANLKVGSKPPAEQLADVLVGTAHLLAAHRPRVVLVQGDTNTVLGAALAGHKAGIAVAHLEAGLRSDDWEMPEEGNRVLAGRVAALHFCPTALQAGRLAAEGITRGVYVVGNTVVDATVMYAERARSQSSILRELSVEAKGFGLLTLHRPSNVDDPDRLRALLSGLAVVARERRFPLVFPIHPRTAEKIRQFDLSGLLAHPYLAIEPAGYLDMLQLLQHARLVFTDSGGVQEESCTLGVPCITLRANTERPETVQVGANVLCDSTEREVLDRMVDDMLSRPRGWTNPLGDGRAAGRVVDVLLDPSAPLKPSGVAKA